MPLAARHIYMAFLSSGEYIQQRQNTIVLVGCAYNIYLSLPLKDFNIQHIDLGFDIP